MYKVLNVKPKCDKNGKTFYIYELSKDGTTIPNVMSYTNYPIGSDIDIEVVQQKLYDGRIINKEKPKNVKDKYATQQLLRSLLTEVVKSSNDEKDVIEKLQKLNIIIGQLSTNQDFKDNIKYLKQFLDKLDV